MTVFAARKTPSRFSQDGHGTSVKSEEQFRSLNNILSVLHNKNSVEVDIAPAFGEITTACKVSSSQLPLLQRN